MQRILLLLLILSMSGPFTLLEAQNESADTLSLEDINLSAMSFRSIGPAITGGRIVTIGVNPDNTCEYYVGSGHGSLWKTSNCGTTFQPVFDGQKSYSIGAVTVDPSNPNTVWVGPESIMHRPM